MLKWTRAIYTSLVYLNSFIIQVVDIVIMFCFEQRTLIISDSMNRFFADIKKEKYYETLFGGNDT